jgi:pyruvate-formate lyase
MPNRPFDLELKFTETFRRHQNEPLAIREAQCLRVLFPDSFCPLQPGDLFAGRLHIGAIGFGLEQDSGGLAGYGICRWDGVEEINHLIESSGIDGEYLQQVQDMMEFWEKETTINKYQQREPAEIKQALSGDIATGSCFRLAGAMLDFDKLVHRGIPGLVEDVQTHKSRAMQEGRDTNLYDGMQMALDLFVDVCRYYARQAGAQALATDDDNWKSELHTIARILEKIAVSRPDTLREAAQLVWLYALISSVVNYGRMDVYLGDFYVHDIETGVLNEEKAVRLLCSLWKLIADRNIVFNGRIIVGGRGRRNEANADRFTLAAMEASRLVIETEPQLTLRFYTGMAPTLFSKALDVIGEGRPYPMLYNDDVNIPAVMKAFNVSEADAEQYLPYGCGEYMLDHVSVGSPNCNLMMLKALEVTLHNGKNGLDGKPMGIPTGEFTCFKTFEELWNAYTRQIEYHIRYQAMAQAFEYQIEAEDSEFLYVSLLYDHCLERGKSFIKGGARYRGGAIETFGMVNVADSLAAIKELVYDRKVLTAEQLLAALDANFEGYERERQMMLKAPKYGNDDDRVDLLAQAVSDHASRFTYSQAVEVRLDYYLIVNINNYANVYAGKCAAASADGRLSGEPLANGNTPTAGRDTSGVTAFLNSISKIDPSYHAGYVHNMKFSPQMFRDDRRKTEALLHTYFEKGGTQAMITVVGRGDLEAALREPDKYRNLIVRVGGFSARFVELAPEVQADLLARTLY